LCVPDSSEVHAIITDSQSQLAVLACLVLIAEVPRSWWGKLFDVALLTLFALTTPVGILLLAVAMARRLAVRLYWMMRQGWDYQQWVKFGSHAGQPENRRGVQ